MMRSIYSVAIALVAGVSLSAQETVPPITMQFGAGFTEGVGRTGQDVNIGWNAGGGIGYNFNNRVSALVDIGSQVLTTSATVPNNLSVAGGRMTIFSATLDPVVHLMPGSHIDVYATGGGGMFRRSFTPAQTFALLSDYSVIKPGFDAGMGFAVGSPWHGKFFAEARYVHIFDNNHFFTSYVPVTFGYRW